jgi:hypothetical protein
VEGRAYNLVRPALGRKEGEMSTEHIKRRIFASISDLIMKEPASEKELMDWHEQAKEVKALMRLDNGDIQVPHAFWHYLDDADIRMKDQRYAEAQILQIEELLRTWVN